MQRSISRLASAGKAPKGGKEDAEAYTDARSGRFSDCLFDQAERPDKQEKVRSLRRNEVTSVSMGTPTARPGPPVQQLSEYWHNGGGAVPQADGKGATAVETGMDDKRLVNQFLQLSSIKWEAEARPGLTATSSYRRSPARSSMDAQGSVQKLENLWFTDLSGMPAPGRSPYGSGGLAAADAAGWVGIFESVLEGLESDARTRLLRDVFPRVERIEEHEESLHKMQRDISEVQTVLRKLEEEVRIARCGKLKSTFDSSNPDSFIFRLEETINTQLEELNRIDQNIAGCRIELEEHKTRMNKLETTVKVHAAVKKAHREMKLSDRLKRYYGMISDVAVLLAAVFAWRLARYVI